MEAGSGARVGEATCRVVCRREARVLGTRAVGLQGLREAGRIAVATGAGVTAGGTVMNGGLAISEVSWGVKTGPGRAALRWRRGSTWVEKRAGSAGAGATGAMVREGREGGGKARTGARWLAGRGACDGLHRRRGSRTMGRARGPTGTRGIGRERGGMRTRTMRPTRKTMTVITTASMTEATTDTMNVITTDTTTETMTASMTVITTVTMTATMVETMATTVTAGRATGRGPSLATGCAERAGAVGAATVRCLLNLGRSGAVAREVRGTGGTGVGVMGGTGTETAARRASESGSGTGSGRGGVIRRGVERGSDGARVTGHASGREAGVAVAGTWGMRAAGVTGTGTGLTTTLRRWTGRGGRGVPGRMWGGTTDGRWGLRRRPRWATRAITGTIAGRVRVSGEPGNGARLSHGGWRGRTRRSCLT